MTVPEELDADRLHKVTETLLNGGYRYRKQGKTVAYLELMVGDLLLGDYDNTYLYIANSMERAEEVCSAMRALIVTTFGDSAIRHYSRRQIECEHGAKFYFGSVDFTHSLLCGLRLDRAFVDLDDKQIHQLELSGKWQEFVERLLVCLCERNGDII